MLQKLKDRLIHDARYWWKMWSSWLAILWGMIVTVLWNDPAILPSLLNSLPGETRALLSPVIVVLVSGIPIIVRLIKQQKKDCSDAEKG